MALKPLKYESELLALVAKGDDRAFVKLFEGYYKQLGEYVYKLTESIEVSEEIVQDVFIKVWLRRETLLELDNFCHYLFILCRNQTLNHLRKKASERVHQLAWLKQFEQDQFQSDNDEIIEGYRILMDKVIEKLPPQQKKVFKLSREGRLKHDEIANLLGISPETVKKHIKLALRFIRSEFSSSNYLPIFIILSSQLIFL
ncbi:hypothetical protein ASU31_00605 [Pedobacter ginsenosidimutans]|uniref:RNA polymerase subunit sigma-24 n=1 Tax=Pedobacter ginsenosidimutans TaxID=687842 RepID=A0A0T5VVD8_9SPHI|nr:RNA polymerase sigma-70 factor [Pedobacter ginsenosidimutans]KRT17831.1 hypothetical protein ASU31_00605 [Pedobacter ginsenosidimutans]